MKERVEDIILSSPVNDGQPRGTTASDPTFAKAAKLGNYPRIIQIIDEERDAIQSEYRKGVWDNIQHGSRYPDDADRRTYSRHKSKFVYHVAKRIGYI